MRRKPSIAIVGPGKLGAALAVLLREAGYPIAAVVGGSRGGAQKLASQVGARGAHLSAADVVWFTVPDSNIARAAQDLAGKLSWKGRAALHSSGALTSDELDVVRRKGAAVASAHPLMTFVRGSRPSLAGVPFAVEGDSSAVQVAQAIIRDLGGKAHRIAKRDKTAYHTWATFASPLLTALLATTERVAGIAGVKGKAARKRMTPILLETLSNYVALGAANGFSGPILRGDVETVRRHLQVLHSTSQARAVYVALARAALEYLPGKNRPSLRQLLSSRR